MPIGDRTNLCYSSTVVTKGRGTGVVIGTGMNTQVRCKLPISESLADDEADRPHRRGHEQEAAHGHQLVEPPSRQSREEQRTRVPVSLPPSSFTQFILTSPSAASAAAHPSRSSSPSLPTSSSAARSSSPSLSSPSRAGTSRTRLSFTRSPLPSLSSPSRSSRC